MKKFVKHIFAFAICAAALLSSCIKEEAYVRETAELNVSLTRAGTTSVEQGDAIKDAWIWAFQCTLDDTTGAPSIDDSAVPMGSRYVSGLNSYNNIAVHVPLPICDGSQDYLLVAVINTEAFGTLNLNAKSTWGTIKTATFSQTGAFWSTYPLDSDKTPEVMPISNWATFKVTSGNTHSSNCYNLNLPVYRAVAKAQFSVAKTDDFDLEIVDVDVVANSAYSNGALLTASPESATGSNSEAIQRGKPDATATTWWWASPAATTRAEGATDPAVTYQLKNSDAGFTAKSVTATVDEASHGDSATYDWVASTFLFENNNDAAYGEGVYDSAQGDGYNLCVQYKVDDGDVKTVYTPLGKVVRNHDYHVKALVEAGSGEMTFTVTVNQWVVEEQILNYQDVASVASDGHIKWSNLPTVSGFNAINESGQVEAGKINLTAAGGQTATFTFTLATPVTGTWIAELRTIKGDAGDIVFADGTTLMEGPIDNLANTITIKNLSDNLASAGSVENQVELHIYAKAYWGDTLRSYRVDGIIGALPAGVTPFANYVLVQPTI